MFDGLPVTNVRVACAIFLPGGGLFAHYVEHLLPDWLPWGGFLAVSVSRPTLADTT